MLRLVTTEHFVLAAALLSTVSALSAHEGLGSAESTEIKKVLEKEVQDPHLHGIAGIVIRSDTVVGIAAAGVRRRGDSTPLASDDMFHLGSNTKAITATMVARLVE